MLATVRRQIDEERLFTRGDRIVIGVSGGTDSIALLHILWSLNAMYHYGWELHVVHLNHQFRGAESEQDAEYVRSLCQSLGVIAHLYARDVSGYMRATGLGAQEASRNIRYQLYAEVAERIGANKVALAHHADDQVETIVFRMLRGTGLHGLTGMPLRRWLVEHRIEVVRPLLTVYRSQLEAYCKQAKLSPREDSSNRSRKYERNRLRLDVLPLFAEVNSKYREHILQLADIARIDDEYLLKQSREQLAELITSQSEGRISICVNKFQSCDLALQRRMITLILSYLSSGIEWSSQHVEAVLHIIEGANPSAVIHLPKKLVVQRVYQHIHFSRSEAEQAVDSYCYELNLPGTTWIPESGLKFHTSLVNSLPQGITLAKTAAVFDADQVKDQLWLRTRKSGDRISLLGTNGSKKLKDVLIDAKVPKRLRDALPLLVVGETIVWIPGVRRSTFATVSEQTERLLYVEVEYGEEWREVFE